MSTLRVTNIQDLAGNNVFVLSGGNATIAGDLTVQGTTTSIETTNLTIEDKNIVLGLTDPAATDTTADGGGITLKGTTDKTIAWSDTTNAWTSSEYLDLPVGVLEVTTPESEADAIPSLIFGGDSDSGFYHPAANSLGVVIAGSEAARIDSDGNFGIGTDDPSTVLHLAGNTPIFTIEDTNGANPASSRTVLLRDDDSYQVQIRNSTGAYTATAYTMGLDANGPTSHEWRIGNSEKVRIDSSGNVGIGTTDPQAPLNVVGKILVGPDGASLVSSPDHQGNNIEANIQVVSEVNLNPSISLTNARSNDIGAPCFMLNKASGSLTTPTIVGNDNTAGSLVFSGYDGANYIRAAQIDASIDGTPGTNDMPGRLVFSTTADGASTPTERMRIDSTGDVGINTTDPQAKLDVKGDDLGLTAGDSVSLGRFYGLTGVNESQFNISHERILDGTNWPTTSIKLQRVVGVTLQGYIDFTAVRGTSTSQSDIAFGSATTERMRITSQGNVGIGTTDPLAKLQIKADSNAVDDYPLTLTNNAVNYGMQFGAYGASNKTFGASTIDYTIEIGGDLILNPTGNVGIGTDDPAAKLHIETPTAQGWQLRLDSTGLSNESGFYRDANDNYEAVLRSGAGALSYIKNSGGAGAANLFFYVQGSDRLNINSSGNIGIGTNTQGSRLAVNGSITESTDGGTTYHNVVTAQDIGTDPNQVPLNQFLGQLAFMDSIGDVPTASTPPQDNLAINFEYVSNTSIKIRMRGTDGVVRSVTLTLS